jgi:PAS domain S-box-containing protein/putative nucleotidyltransferase with HDIG domain
MTVVGQDAIVAWTDLTDIRSSEMALLESERRFRSMVEQTLTAMFVRRNGRFIYVNPRFLDITGWQSSDLLGQSVLEFTDPNPENIATIRQNWADLHDGKHKSVTYTASMRCKNGQLLEIGLTAQIITWDDGEPATIVLVTDITEQKRAEQQIAAYVRQLEAAMRGTMQAVSNMVEMRDPYTAGHERRVGLIASAIAHELGWEAARCESLELLGLVHDIGKIAIPSEILTKPTRLTPLEREMMKGHVQAGYDILKNVPFPMPVAEIIRQHHERMDGSGYPQGLKGEEILPEARILAVADVLESMASHRPYRAAVGLEAALAEVVNNRGRLYAPEVVDAAVRLIQEKGYQLPT